MKIDFNVFSDRAALDAAVVALLKQEFERPSDCPFGVMLSGGSTPLPIYAVLAKEAVQSASGLHLMFTDDRHVPAASPDSNYGNTLPLIEDLGLDAEEVLRVNGDVSLEAAADEYAADLSAFFDAGGVIRLAILGMGSDGHTCSLFTKDAATRRDVFAFPVPGTGGFNRVTVSAAVLAQAQRIAFLVAGESKQEILQQFKAEPQSIPAGVAVKDCRNVEVWTDVAV